MALAETHTATELSSSEGGVALAVRNLRVVARNGEFPIIDEVSFDLRPGEKLGLVGESGSGKTTVAMALLGYATPSSRIESGSVQVAGKDILALGGAELRRARGSKIAYVPQDPSTALTPNLSIRRLLREMTDVHGASRQAEEAIQQALRDAQLPTEETFGNRYPFELSGGQQQRLAIALALVCRPGVIVMDEPTTGLDVTTQARLLGVIREIIQETKATVVYVSHDLGVVRNLVDRVAVMYGGRIVDVADVDDLFAHPRHPYTRRLLEAVPRIAQEGRRPRGIGGSVIQPGLWPTGCPFAPRCELASDICSTAMPPIESPTASARVRCYHWQTTIDEHPTTAQSLSEILGAPSPTLPAAGRTETVLEVHDLYAGYNSAANWAHRVAKDDEHAVAGVSFAVQKGICTALVGESGSGKTTTLRCIAGLHSPSSGSVIFEGNDLEDRARKRTLSQRRLIQLVPQNPDSSLNPHHTVEAIVGRPLRQFFGMRRAAQQTRVMELLSLVRLSSAMTGRYPRELSGGEKQRVALARALASQPDLLLCDEITAPLDVAVQAGILDLLDDLRVTLGMTILFVSHDLAVVGTISKELIVIRNGTIRERGITREIFRNPSDAYTAELLAAVPDLRPDDYPAGKPEAP